MTTATHNEQTAHAERVATWWADLDALAASEALDPFTVQVGRAMARHADDTGLVRYGLASSITQDVGSTRAVVGDAFAALFRAQFWVGHHEGLLIIGGDR